MSRPSPVHAVDPLNFDPNQWAKRYRDNAVQAQRNSLMDFSWSAAVADNCVLTGTTLLTELFRELKKVELKPEDFFDRPELAAVLTAVIEASK